MMYHKLKKVHISDENACILITTPHEIIINQGLNKLTVFDYNLTQINEIQLPERLFIYGVFKRFSESELLLYSVDEKDGNRLVYTNLQSNRSNIVASIPQEVIFSPIYNWIGEVPLLSDYHDNFYRVWVKEKKIALEQRSTIKESYPLLYKFYAEALFHRAERVYPELFQYIYIPENNNIVCFIDVKKKQKKVVRNIYPQAHDYECRNEIFLLVGEQKIVVSDALKQEEIFIYPEKNYHFMHSSFLTDNLIVTFSSYRENRTLALYTIDTMP